MRDSKNDDKQEIRVCISRWRAVSFSFSIEVHADMKMAEGAE